MKSRSALSICATVIAHGVFDARPGCVDEYILSVVTIALAQSPMLLRSNNIVPSQSFAIANEPRLFQGNGVTRPASAMRRGK
jgi:hypothetical protein